MARNTLSILILFLSLSFSNKALSQCGNILLTTQAEVDNYFTTVTCTTVTGNLDINDDGTDPITNLNAIASGGISTINGDLRIENCNSLSNLNGLQNISTIGFDLVLINNAILNDISALDDVVTIGGRLEIAFTGLNEISTFSSLESISGSILLYDNPSMTTVSGFPLLTDIGANLEVFNIGITNIDGFSSITNISGNILFGNVPLGDGLPNFPVGMTIQGNVTINQCADIISISPLENIASIGGDLTITSCSGITECCFLLDYPAISPGGSIILNNNGVGCSALSEIGAEPPVLSGIPAADQTISCDDLFPDLPNPTAMDDCDGDVTSSIVFTSDVTTSDCSEATASIHEYEWTVMDESGNTTTETWTVTVENDFMVDLGPDIVECGLTSADLTPDMTGISYEWSTGETTQSITVESSGIYEVSVTTSNGCCASDFVEVGLLAQPIATATGGTINCLQESVMLQGSSSVSSVTYSWSGPNGFASNEQNPTVAEGGEYNLIVTTLDGCDDTAIATVVLDVANPDISVAGGTIDCINPTTTLTGSSATPDVTFEWTGPNGFVSTMENPTVTEGGEYTLAVTAANGCVSLASTQVVADISVPDISISGGTIDCINSSLQLNGSSATPDVTFQWNGPNGFTSMMQNPTITEAGQYDLTVTATNGCTSSATTQVIDNTELPDISISGGTIDCTNTSTTLMANSTTLDVTYLWMGPGGFMTTIQNPTVTESGQYVLSITAPNGCTSTAATEVTTDGSLPTITVSGGTLDCTTSSVTLEGSSTSADVTYAWTGPGGFTSMMQNPTVTVSGSYTLSVTAPNGCSSMATAQVLNETTPPDLSVAGGTIDCANDSVVLDGSSMTADVSFAWTGPNGFESTLQNPTVTVVGDYQLSITGPNGCVNMGTAQVLSDTAVPSISIASGSVVCDSQIIAIVLSTDAVSPTYSWTGPAGFMSTLQNPLLSTIGVYTCEVTGANGCTSTDSYELTDIFNYTETISTTDATATMGGTAQITLTGGTGPFSIDWDNGDTGTEASDLAAGIHTVSVEDGLGCSEVFTFEILMSTSTNEIVSNQQHFEIFPNPALNHVTVDWATTSLQPTLITVFDLEGKQLHKVLVQNTGQQRVDVSVLPAGVYLIQLTSQSESLVSRLIKF